MASLAADRRLGPQASPNAATLETHRMLKTEILAPSVLKIVAPETLTPTTLLALALASQVDSIIKDHGEIWLLIDASHLEGWDSLATLEKHAGFVKAHQAKVTRIAVVARRDWQHWLVGAVKVFLHPEVKSFDPGHESDAALDREGRPQRRDDRSRRVYRTPRRGRRRRTLTGTLPPGDGAKANTVR
jgi:hypothetical protein